MATTEVSLKAGSLDELAILAREVVERWDARTPVRDSRQPVTNDDYRGAIDCIPAGKVASYSTVSMVVRGDEDGATHVAGICANDTSGTLAHAYRVITKKREIAAGFRWVDGRRGGRDEAR